MEYQTLGRTGLMVSRTAFELKELKNENEIQAYSVLLQNAYENGINFFAVNAAHEITLEALGKTFAKVRTDVRYCVISEAQNDSELYLDIQQSLDTLECTFIDILSIKVHSKITNLSCIDTFYAVANKMKKAGQVKHIGLRTASLNCAREAVISGGYEIISYDFSAIATKEDEALVNLCDSMEIGFTAINPNGYDNLINIPLSFGYLNQFENVIALWPLTTDEKLRNILYFAIHPPIQDGKFKQELLAFKTR